MEKQSSSVLIATFLASVLIFCPLSLDAKTPPFKNFDRPRLIESGELANGITHPLLRIVDLRTSFSDYLKDHLPMAVYLHFENLRVPRNGIPGQIPDRIFLEKIFGEYLGISNDMWVVFYSEKSNPNATYLAWALDFLGHKRAGVLNGGWEKWVAEKLPTTQEFPTLQPKKFFGKVIQESVADKKWVESRLSAKNGILVDARSPKQYSGEEGEEIRKGHIPGARNLFWEATLEGEEVRTWKKREDLERIFSDAGISRNKEILVYCRTGREASHVTFTLKHVLDFPHVRLYRGSWVEWSSFKNLPVKTGMEP
jgi:thiosulfate/3-mercaptopyruvate sulfurtransferase